MSRDIEMKAWHIQNLMDVNDDIQVVPMIDAREVVESLEDDNKVLEDALRMLWNDVGGGTKKCGHNFCCSCAGDNAKKVLDQLTTNKG